jgi:hypothetical protein
MRQSSDSCKENLQIVHLCLAKAPKPLDSCLPLLLSTLHVVPGPPVVDQRAACGMARKDHRGSVFANRYVTNKRPFVNECKGAEQAALCQNPLAGLLWARSANRAARGVQSLVRSVRQEPEVVRKTIGFST